MGRSSVWLERYVRDVEVAGSNPVAPTIFSILRRPLWSVFSFLFEDQSEFFTFCHIIAETNFESVIFSISATHCFKRA